MFYNTFKYVEQEEYFALKLERVNGWWKLIIKILEATLGVLSVIPLLKLRPNIGWYRAYVLLDEVFYLCKGE